MRTPNRMPKATTVFGSMVGALRSSESKYRTSPALDISPPEFWKVNVDEEQDVANEYQVRSLPTLIVENDDGIVERFVGVTQREDIESALEEAGA